MISIKRQTLHQAGFPETCPEDYDQKLVTLRDGEQASIWIHKQTGHGILDSLYWPSNDFYLEAYRNESGPEIGKKITPQDHLAIYEKVNERQFLTFSQHLSRNTKFLEIGCSYGGIIGRVNKFGVSECHAVEPNKADAAFVQKKNKQAKLYNTTLEKAELQNDFYDLVVSIEVLEHVVSPRAFLEKCFKIIKPDGLIHLEVPNLDDGLLTAYRNTGYDRFFYHKAHIHYFTEKSLRALCLACGFQGEISCFLMYPFFNHVWWCQNHGPQSSATEALSTPKPTEGGSPAAVEINEFYQKVEEEYDKLMNRHMLGDCLIFQGRRI